MLKQEFTRRTDAGGQYIYISCHLVVLDALGVIRYCSPSVERALGLTCRPGDSWRALFPRLTISTEVGCLTATLNGCSFRITWGPLKLIDREPGLTWVIISDITSSETTAIQLKETIRDLEAILEGCSDIIYVSDGTGKTLRVSASCERLMGVLQDDLVGQNVRDLERRGVFRPSATAMVLDTKKPVTLVQETLAGKRLLVNSNPIFDDRGNLVRIINSSTDVTELNHLRQQLARTQSLVERYRREIDGLRSEMGEPEAPLARSPKMREVLTLVENIAEVDTTVLILGESGVGKEVLARYIHRRSRRKDQPFVVINCGAIPDNLFESELFGYERGAFTGANREGKVGLMEMANKGTLFLDELGDLPLPLQVKLLRALQEHKIIRVGGLKPIEVDIRVIAATNQDLSRLVGEGKFREDLYYRLDVVPVVIPPLRERTEDIPLLAHHLLARFGQRYGRPKEMTTSAMDALVAYPWPGNIRQLENLIERLVVTTLESTISLEHLPESIRRRAQAESLHDKSTEVETIEDGDSGVKRGVQSSGPDSFLANLALIDADGNFFPLKDVTASFEACLIRLAISKTGSTYRAARALGINQSTIIRKLQKKTGRTASLQS